MVAVNDSARVSEAIVIWTGFGQAPTPSRDEERLVQRFGDEAVDLLPTVQRLEDDFYASDAHHVAIDLVEMARLAADDFRAQHPHISDEAVRALAWCYTYDYK